MRSIRREYISVRLFNICIAYANVIVIIIRTVYKYKLDEGYSSRTLHNARLFFSHVLGPVGGHCNILARPRFP